MHKFCLWGLLLVSLTATAADIKFQKAGQLVKSLPDADLSKVAPAGSIEVYEPHEQQTIHYKGYRTADLFDAIFGAVWRKEEEVLFTCIDGYQPSIPVASFLASDSYLVFERVGASEFGLTNKLQANEKVALGPLYLVWDNIKTPALKAEGASQWPYQIVGIDLVSFQSRFGGMAPAAGASAAVKSGFLDFRKGCTNCHRINGVGGEKSIELNYPLSVTEYFRPGFLNKWIEQPQNVRFGSLMPPFNPDHPERKKAIAGIVSYLEHMAQNKKKPAPAQP